MIAIHNNKRTSSFQYRWIEYCEKNNIPFKLVDSYSSDIIDELKDCDAFMWHYYQADPKDIVMAKPLLFSLEQAGKKVFPDFNTAWHFDDKVGQKYLLEALGMYSAKTWVFYDKDTAAKWISTATFPKVFKLRGGAGSMNVQLVRSKEAATALANKAFGKGFPAHDAWGDLKERLRKWKEGKTGAVDVLKGIARLFNPPAYAKVMGREINYLYFQEFLPGNDSDIRIIVIDGKAFGLKRMVRENDFRASGSGTFQYEREVFDERCVQLSFDYTHKLKAQCVAYDYVFDTENKPVLVEVSYGFSNTGYDDCPGYWDEQLNWHEGKFNPYGWMVEMMRR
jgi:glutathione synthase/RimK-type ligase-like ATP-grasp enzyme